MDEFDRLLEVELARMLDGVVRMPAPPRRRRPRRRPILKLLISDPMAATGPFAPVVILADARGGMEVETAALFEAHVIASPALLY
jgi:hypothetical protein